MRLYLSHSQDTNNFDIDGNLISQTNSDGSSDVNIPKYDQGTNDPSIDLFREYTFTNEDLRRHSSHLGSRSSEHRLTSQLSHSSETLERHFDMSLIPIEGRTGILGIPVPTCIINKNVSSITIHT